MGSHRNTSEARRVCMDILAEARKIKASGHTVVFTSPEDKSPLNIAYELRDALGGVQEPVRTAACPSGKRFSPL